MEGDARALILVAVGWRFEQGSWVAYDVNAILYDGSDSHYQALSETLMARQPWYYWTFGDLFVPCPSFIPWSWIPARDVRSRPPDRSPRRPPDCPPGDPGNFQ